MEQCRFLIQLPYIVSFVSNQNYKMETVTEMVQFRTLACGFSLDSGLRHRHWSMIGMRVTIFSPLGSPI